MLTHDKFEVTAGALPDQNARSRTDGSRPAPLFNRNLKTHPGVSRSLLTIAACLAIGVAFSPLHAQNAVTARVADYAALESHSSITSSEPFPGDGFPAEHEAATETANAPLPSNHGIISGTVLDVNGDLIPGATVVLKGVSTDGRREVVADDNGAFKFDTVNAGIPYQVTVYVKGFSTWTSPSLVLEPSQVVFLNDIHLKMEADPTSVTVYASPEQIAVEQVRLAEQQRVLGFVPNFYVVYDSDNAVPLTPKLKFKLAMRVSRDPITIAGVGFMAGIKQAANTPDYVQGAKGYGQRLGAEAAEGFSDILIGGAVLPSLLHQDPRYFYQGTGSTTSRLRHALVTPFICRGDNGHLQPNFSSLGGDLASTALTNAYYPDSNRGVGTMFGTFAISTVERMFAAVAQEFILPRFTKGKPSR